MKNETKTKGTNPMKNETKAVTKIQKSMHDIFREATSEPGKISRAYRLFHNFSPLNQCAAVAELSVRNIPLGPIATFKQWQDKGRIVKKGEKAISLCMPVPVVKKDENSNRKEGEISSRDKVFTFFKWTPRWFAYSQTEALPGFEGQTADQDLVANDNLKWTVQFALETLDIVETDFDHINGNTMGYATPLREIAINPMCPFPLKTRIHEIAHIVLGHLDGESIATGMAAHGYTLPRSIKEFQAESVAYIVCSMLNYRECGALESARAYIQSYMSDVCFEDKIIRQIFQAVDKIVKAGEIVKNESVYTESAK